MTIGDRVLKRVAEVLENKGYSLKVIRRGRDLRVEIAKGQESVKMTLSVRSLDVLSDWLREGEHG